MSSLAQFFIRNDKFTIVLSAFVAIGGILGLTHLNSESYPAVNFATAVITTQYSGASSRDVETLITKPIEDEIRSVKGLKDVRSVSKPGTSEIVVRVDMDNENVKEVMDEVKKAVDRVTDLPMDLQELPSFLEVKSEEFPALELALVGDNTNRARDLMAEKIQEDLEDNKRVLNVRLVGHRPREFKIYLKQTEMDKHHISIDEVIEKVRMRNQDIPGGKLKNSQAEKLIRLEAKIDSKSDIENILIRSNLGGPKIYLKDLATIHDDMKDPEILVRFDNQPAVLLVVTKKGGADTLALVDEIEEKLEKYKNLPGNLNLTTYISEAEKVKNRLDILASNAFSGLFLVIFFLLIFLPGKIGLMASISLPLAVLGTFGLMPAFGMNLDTITILALVIALGMLVDNSVVIAENFTRLRTEGMGPGDAAMESIRSLWAPITATAFTTIAAFLPMLVTTGIMGEFIKWIPIVVTMALLLSLFESFFLLPMRLYKTSSEDRPKIEKTSQWYINLQTRFENITRLLLRFRWFTLVGYLGIFIVSILFIVKFNKFILFPPDQIEMYLVRGELETGTRVEKTDEFQATLDREIRTQIGDYVKHITYRSGISGMGPGDPNTKSGANQSLAIVYVNDEAKYNVSHNLILEKLREINIPNYTLSFEAQLNGPPVGEAINGTLRSNDAQQLFGMVEQLKEKLRATPGIFDVRDNLEIGTEEIHLIPNYDLIDQLGLSIAQIGNTLRSAYDGSIASKVNLLNKEIDLKIEISPEDKTSIDQLQDLKVPAPGDYLVPISKLGSLEKRDGTPIIKRFDFQRSKTITANIDDKIITSVAANEIFKQEFENLKREYPAVSLTFGGEQESTNESLASLRSAMILALLGIAALLVLIFNSYLRPLIIMSTIPLGLLGFSVAFFFHQRPISFLALIGIIGLTGIIVNSGIILISFIEELKAEGKLNLEEILVKASGIRLRAVIVTSLTTVSGLFPTAYGIGGSDPILVPMTLAMFWGLTTGTILTLVWVPCAYAMLEDTSLFAKKCIQRVPLVNKWVTA